MVPYGHAVGARRTFPAEPQHKLLGDTGARAPAKRRDALTLEPLLETPALARYQCRISSGHRVTETVRSILGRSYRHPRHADCPIRRYRTRTNPIVRDIITIWTCTRTRHARRVAILLTD